MNVERANSRVTYVPQRRRCSPHESAKAFGSEAMRPVGVENVTEEESMSDFLPVHAYRVEWTKEVERCGKLLERLIIEEQTF
jgi:hypothetical protein